MPHWQLMMMDAGADDDDDDAGADDDDDGAIRCKPCGQYADHT